MRKISKSDLLSRAASFMGNAKLTPLWNASKPPKSELALVARFPLSALPGKTGGEIEDLANERVPIEDVFPFHNGWPDRNSIVDRNFKYLISEGAPGTEEDTHFIVTKSFSSADEFMNWLSALPEENFLFGEAHEVTLSLQRVS